MRGCLVKDSFKRWFSSSSECSWKTFSAPLYPSDTFRRSKSFPSVLFKMKTVAFVILCAIAVLVVVDYAYAQQGLCDSWDCSDSCYEQGLHGQCDSDDICRCYNCIYRACKKNCLRQGRVGQCDESHCMCL